MNHGTAVFCEDPDYMNRYLQLKNLVANGLRRGVYRGAIPPDQARGTKHALLLLIIMLGSESSLTRRAL